MDIKTLVVGQDVYIIDGGSTLPAKVIKVTPEGVEVETARKRLLRFNNEGRCQQCIDGGWLVPWRLDKMPFEERTALRNIQRLMVGQPITMRGGPFGPMSGKVIKVTPEGVEASVGFDGPTPLKEENRFPWIRYFDANGKEREPPEFPNAVDWDY
jgi:hypothetical protein